MARRKSYRERKKAQQRQRQLLLWGGAAVAVLAVAVIVYNVAFTSEGPQPGTAVPSLGNAHLQSIDAAHPEYNSNPPTSGPHVELHPDSRILTEPIAKEIQVHQLEHGGVLVQYNCEVYAGDCAELRNRLVEITNPYDQINIAPYPEMDSAIALTAWERIDKMDEVDEGRITTFIEAYVGVDHQ